MNKFKLLHTFSLLSTLLLSACGGGGGGSSPTSTASTTSSSSSSSSSSSAVSSSSVSSSVAATITFTDASVHDPAIIKVANTYYVFGSHLAAAKTTDLMNWTQMPGSFDAGSPLFDTVTTQFKEALDWFKSPYTGTNKPASWAPDVRQLGDGKFYFYYDICDNTSRAALGVAVADNVEGPYVNKQVFLRSGMWGQVSEDGVNNYDNAIHPNVVDPNTFFDKDGKLWMIYGSYSGGIFILAMDPATGLPQPNQGYGKHLMGGNNSRIEASYVIYNPTTAYYYMFTSFGGLDANGGYNMRVSRSVNPDGPYYDASGKDMAEVKGAAGTIFHDVDYQPYGQKLMGNFQFALAAGESGTPLGYVSSGHNSAYYEASTNQYFVFFHTRFPGTGEAHQVRVHEFFFNEDGWIVVSPFRYAPLSLSPTPLSAEVTEADTAGSYKYINHGKDITATIVQSQAIKLNADHSVSGAVSGTWAHKGNNYVDITLTSGGLFRGVLSRQWNTNANQFEVTFTAQSQAGVSIWGARTGD